MSIKRYLNQTIAKKTVIGYDEEAQPSFSTETTFRGRLQETNEKIETAEGKQFQIDAMLWVGKDQALELDEQVIFDSQNYKIIKIETKRGFGGKVNHKKAFLQKLA